MKRWFGTLLLLLSGALFAQVTTSPSVTGVPAPQSAVAITGGSINGTPIGQTTTAAGSFTTLTTSSTLTPSSTSGIVGTTTNDSANAGSIGEYLSATVASGAAVSLVTATAKNVTSLSLTAGDWMVYGACDHVGAAASTTIMSCSVSATTNTAGTQPGGSGIGVEGLATFPLVFTTTSFTMSQVVSPVRVSLAATTTIYLVASDTFSAGTMTVYGSIYARRAR